ncbi:hypothetical protein CCP3SC15_2010003 [Gammaproteobacteria bacterium]
MSRFSLVLRHARAMYRNLSQPRNRQKGHWRKIPTHELLRLLRRELEELEAALWACEHGGDPGQVEAEAADLSNFAAMLADNFRRQPCKTERPVSTV